MFQNLVFPCSVKEKKMRIKTLYVCDYFFDFSHLMIHDDVFVIYYFSYGVCQYSIQQLAKTFSSKKFDLPPVKSCFVEIRGFERIATIHFTRHEKKNQKIKKTKQNETVFADTNHQSMHGLWSQLWSLNTMPADKYRITTQFWKQVYTFHAIYKIKIHSVKKVPGHF